MDKLLKLRFGVSHDPVMTQPSLHDCLEQALQQAEYLMTEVLNGLSAATGSGAGTRRVASLHAPAVKATVLQLLTRSREVRESYRDELTRLVYEGGGKEQVHTEALRFEDLQLFEDAQLDQSIEVARAQQEVSLAVDDVLPALDAVVSTLMGWRTIQPGLNPLRPDVFVRALQACLAMHVPNAPVREALIAPAAGLLGANLRRLYRELTDWLRSGGIEPAVPIGGRPQAGAASGVAVVADSVAKTLLTLDKLRKLLAGDFDPHGGGPKADFLHTVPASMVALQDLKQVDAMVQRLELRRRETPPPEPPATLEAQEALEHEKPPAPRLGHQLGEEVVCLMFDTLAQDARLLPQFKRQLKAMEPAVLSLARQDSRFFSDRTHPARQFLDRITQRSLAFSSESDDGWARFSATVEQAVQWLDSKVVDADTFGELTDALHEKWAEHDQVLRARREEAARALLHAEQRNLLAQKLAAEFTQATEGLEVADFVVDFLKGSWSQVVAQAQLSCADGSDDPFGYRAMVEDLIWSVQKSTARRGRQRRLAEMIPGLLAKLRSGLTGIDYPPELTARFFESLITLHHAALQEGREAAAAQASQAGLDEQEAQDTHIQVAEGSDHDVALWLASQEVQDSGYLGHESFLPDLTEEKALAEDEHPDGAPPRELASAAELRTGTWVELMVAGNWLRVQLTWASPHATLFMFTSLAGTAHSMSRRTLERLRTQGLIKVVAERHVVDEALDHVAQAALKNSLDGKPDA